LVAHIQGETEAEGVREWGAEEDIWVYQEAVGSSMMRGFKVRTAQET